MVKTEVEDQLEEEYGPSNKMTKLEWNNVAQMVPPQGLQNNLLGEPSPLGLRLRKSPSLLELIQMRLSQENSTTSSWDTSNLGHEAGKKKDLKSAAVSGTSDKLKASNFAASLLRIGSWECASRYEGDLVAKCYYAKHKLVWEILDGGLKSKIEIQWSDITALKATYSDNIPETLDIVLHRQPLFFREINPQPRKHTLWQATSDFTNGQASIHRRHFLSCPPGMLNRHFEKLTQCDPRLKLLSQRSEIILDFPYFDQRPSVLLGHDEVKGGSHSNSHVPEQGNVMASATPSTSSYSNEISASISGNTNPGNPLFEIDSCDGKFTLDEVTQRLLSESQPGLASDEQSLKVESFCRLIQQDSVADVDSRSNDGKEENGKENESNLSRKESYGDLLMGLPRIQSVPQFLCNILQDS